jgi:hypothetical protein
MTAHAVMARHALTTGAPASNSFRMGTDARKMMTAYRVTATTVIAVLRGYAAAPIQNAQQGTFVKIIPARTQLKNARMGHPQGNARLTNQNSATMVTMCLHAHRAGAQQAACAGWMASASEWNAAMELLSANAHPINLSSAVMEH